jgi:hypothetical protein
VISTAGLTRTKIMAAGIADGASLTPLMIARAVAFGIAMAGVLVGNLVMFSMIKEINRKKPHDEQISDLGFTLGKMLRILDEYRRLCPAGRLLVYYWGSVALLGIGFVGSAVCMFFFA